VASITKESFYEFVKEFWSVVVPDTFIHNWHIEYICDEFQKVATKVIKRLPKDYDLIINVSPGSTKSIICSVMSLPWMWTIDPTIVMLSGSCNASLAYGLALKSRDVVKSPKYKKCFPYIQLRKDQDAKGNFQNTKGGTRLASSVNASPIGTHGHLFVVDDPIDPTEALSELELKNANHYMDSTVSQRKKDQVQSPTILIMQRLHQDDPTAHMMTKAKQLKRLER